MVRCYNHAYSNTGFPTSEEKLRILQWQILFRLFNPFERLKDILPYSDSHINPKGFE